MNTETDYDVPIKKVFNLKQVSTNVLSKCKNLGLMLTIVVMLFFLAYYVYWNRFE